MKAKDLKNEDIPALVGIYTSAAIGYDKGVKEDDSRSVNKQHDIIAAVYRELRSRGQYAQKSLLPLLTHGNPHVRGWAAAHALEFAPSEGEKVLELLTRTRGLLSYTAEMTLKEWKKGALEFP